MAHFAELDSNNTVLRVVVIDNDAVSNNGGDKSSQAETYVKNLLGHSTGGVAWKQTSYNRSFRRSFAGAGCTYDPSADIFISPKPYPSWVKNLTGTKDDGYSDWDAPVAWPGADVEYTDPWGNKAPYYWNWNEENTRWQGTMIHAKDSDNLGITKQVYWDPSSSTAKDV
tara:strand:+ start:85 stop:591 length:507 start_codon:yes stop_codon:yes gene_type:complete